MINKQNKWTKEKVIEESKKYSSRTEFCHSAKGAYVAAHKHGWLSEMPWLKYTRRQAWTKEEVIAEARKYTTVKEFVAKATGAYQAALKNDWMRDLSWLNYGSKSWTRETVIAESHKYKTRTEFSKGSMGAYLYAKKHNILDEMTWLPLLVHSKWTKEECVEESKKYTTRKDFSEHSSGAYTAALKNGWLEEMTWLALLVRPEWTHEECIEISKLYASRSEFQNNAKGAYQASLKNGWLEEMIWHHTPIPGELKQIANHYVYVYLDEENKVCYVGRTNRLKKRDREHRHPYRKPDSLKRYFDSIGRDIPEIVILKEKLLPTESQYWEDYYVKDFFKRGYKIINRAKTGVDVGSLGGGFIKWTKKATFLESKKYRTFGEFRNGNPSASNAASRNGWLKEMTWLAYDQMPNGYWTKERVIEESKKYSSRAEMEKYSLAAYSAALKNGWSEDLPLDYKRVGKNYFTKETVFKLSQGCTSRTDFKNKYSRAYVIARQNGWLDDMPWLYPLFSSTEID